MKTKSEVVTKTKELRKSLDDTLQEIKQLKKDAIDSEDQQFNDRSETIAQVTLAQRDAESAIMRLGMALKYCAEPNPYPESKNPESQVVEKTADNLKM